MNLIYECARPLLAACNPETAHSLTLRGLRLSGRFSGGGKPQGTAVELAGLTFSNRVGLAAGFDKNGEAIVGLTRLGFGFIEIGGVTPLAQPGNPKPRVYRLASYGAVINRLGFNNDGVERIHDRLKQTPAIKPTLLGVNLGINRDTPIEEAARDYLTCMRSLCEFADYFTINISSPNTPRLRELHYGQQLKLTLKSVLTERDKLVQTSGCRLPVFVKVSPDLDTITTQELAQRIREAGCDGLIATNTTTDRSSIRHRLANQEGGLSGRPLLERSLSTVMCIREAVGADFPIVGVGGISSGTDAIAMREAGADLIQVYTALVYRGPRLVRELVSATD
ncbi:MAG: quinone-dependent dihydroorotate dehydrogenase [Gammaproteobacteria bacterium]|nr:quinone-dependent dihydroorotate dehydrogenase [Gammaproteobacteria bacterium]